MRRYLKSIRDMKICDYVTMVQERNSYSTKFPAPANNQTDSPDDGEIMNVLENEMPASWKYIMLVQGFNASEKTPAEFIEFFERLEITEPQTDVSDQKVTQKEKSSGSENDKEKQKTKRKCVDSKKAAEGDCILHGENCGHTSHNCRALKHLAKKTKGSWGKEKAQKKEELHTMLAESFATAMENITKKEKGIFQIQTRI